MRTVSHAIATMSAGTSREVISHHFGSAEIEKKVYIQSSLHSDEIPGMLVSHYLHASLTQLENEGNILGQIVLVPVANPIGLAQDIQGTVFGRFDLATGINFNRGYRAVSEDLIPLIESQLSDDPLENQRIIRRESIKLINAWAPKSQSDMLKKYLQTMAMDADIVLDLHCDNQASMHLYTGTPLAEMTMPLSRYLGARALLLSELSGDDPFDESCSRPWWELARHFADQFPIPLGCQSITVELRGETDLSHELASADADAIIQFLIHSGHIKGTAKPLPEPLCKATPLEGSEPINAPHAGVLVFSKETGDLVKAGEKIADLIDPITFQITPLISSVEGVMFARVARRYVHSGTSVAKVAGEFAFRTGNLLSM
jgi:predicted deacylase